MKNKFLQHLITFIAAIASLTAVFIICKTLWRGATLRGFIFFIGALAVIYISSLFTKKK